MNIKIFSVGGTIDKVYFDKLSNYQVGPPSVREILAGLPIAFEYEIESILRKDSLDMDETDQKKVRSVVEQETCDRILITHGTDRMVETAIALMGIPGKVIVLTGAMEPANFRSSDAVFNIGVAIGALNVLSFGVYLAMNGRVFDPQYCRKNRSRHTFEDTREQGQS